MSMAVSEPSPVDAFQADEPKKTKGVLYIGIDLGTSRTSIAASNGARETVWSYVGYPKDVVARKLLKKDRLYGKEAVEKRLSLNLYRPFEKGIIKYASAEEAGLSQDDIDKHMQAAKDLVRHALSIAKPRKDELLYGVIGAPAISTFHGDNASSIAAIIAAAAGIVPPSPAPLTPSGLIGVGDSTCVTATFGVSGADGSRYSANVAETGLALSS